jgi:glycosyltransferase involved in cell wall biosynthesis
MAGLSVSIAMATYNGAEFIEEQLESIAHQTALPAELIITDDCSTDATLSIAESFAKVAPFPVYIFKNQLRLGFRRNFMHAAFMCRSDIISFCDQDDIWDSRKLKICTALFEDSGILLCYHNALAFVTNGERLGTLHEFASNAPIIHPLTIHPWSLSPGFTQLFRRDLLDISPHWEWLVDQRKITEPMAHDQWFFFLSSALGKIAYIDQPLALYRQHSMNTYGWSPRLSLLSRTARIRRSYDILPHYQEAARRRAVFLGRLAQQLQGTSSDLASQAARAYAELEYRYGLRHRAYVGSTFVSRIGALVTLARSGAYSNASPWDFGAKGLLKELLLLVPFRRY